MFRRLVNTEEQTLEFNVNDPNLVKELKNIKDLLKNLTDKNKDKVFIGVFINRENKFLFTFSKTSNFKSKINIGSRSIYFFLNHFSTSNFENEFSTKYP